MVSLTLLQSEWPKLYGVLAILSAVGLRKLVKDSVRPTVLTISIVVIFFAENFPQQKMGALLCIYL